MLLQTNSYIVPKERRAEHQRLLRRFRQTLARLGCEHFEVYEQVGPNWSTGDNTGRYVQIMRFRDRRHQLSVQSAERADPGAQAVIAEFCNLINFPYQQQQGLFAVGFYQSALPVTLRREATRAEVEASDQAVRSAHSEAEETEEEPEVEAEEADEADEETEAEAETSGEVEDETETEAEESAEPDEETEAEAATSGEVEDETEAETEESAEADEETEAEAATSGEVEDETETEAEESAEPDEETEAEAATSGELEDETEIAAEEASEGDEGTEAEAGESAEADEQTEAEAETFHEAEIEAGVESPEPGVEAIAIDELFQEQAAGGEGINHLSVAGNEAQIPTERRETEVAEEPVEVAGVEGLDFEETVAELNESASIENAFEDPHAVVGEVRENEEPLETPASEAKAGAEPVAAVDDEELDEESPAETEALEDKLFWDDEEVIATAPIPLEELEPEFAGAAEHADAGHASVIEKPAEAGVGADEAVEIAAAETASLAEDEEELEPAEDDGEDWGEEAVEGTRLSAEEGDIEIIYEQLPGNAAEGLDEGAMEGAAGSEAADAEDAGETGFDALLSNEQLLEDIESEEVLEAGTLHTAELHSHIHGQAGRNGNSLAHSGNGNAPHASPIGGPSAETRQAGLRR